jgi:hypothetical protein
MKKFWTVRTNSDLKSSLLFLKIPDNYRKIILENDSEVMNHIKNDNVDYIIITYNDEVNHISTGFFGWDIMENYDHFPNYNYIFCGTVNLRKEKLKKLNELYQ